MAPQNLHTAPPVDDVVPVRHRARRLTRRAAPTSRVSFALGIAAVCTLSGVDLAAGSPVATTTRTASSQAQSVADVLGVDGTAAPVADDAQALGELTASRSQRDAEQAAAGASQAQAEQAVAAARAAAAAQAAAAAAAAAEAAAPAPPAAGPAQAAAAAATRVAKISNSAGPVRPQAQAAADAVVSNVPGAAGITLGGTRASAADPGGHPSGLAIDYMVLSDEALGQAIVQYHVAHWGELGVEYLVYRQRMLSSPHGAWTAMEDRGSATANHMDHVHVNYR